MGCGLYIAAALISILIHWLIKINENYNIPAFFARRVRTKCGRPVESIAPIPKGKTIFANCFDLYGKDDAGVFQHLRQLAKEMGTNYLFYSLGMAMYMIIEPEIVEFILINPQLITKGITYNFVKSALRTGLLTSTGKKWHTRRKMITPTFHFNILEQFEEVFKTESQKFVDKFKDQSETEVSLTDFIPRFALNNICETAMGVNLDEMTKEGDRYRENFKMIEKCFVKRVKNPLQYNDSIYNLFGAKYDEPFLKVVHDFSSNIIAKRRILLEKELQERLNNQLPDDDIYVNTKRRFAVLDTLICAEKDGLIDHEGICEEVDTLMFAGYDTTSITLIFILMNMSLHEDMQEMCYQEISENIGDDLSKLKINHMSQLQYMERFIKETIRMYSSVPIMVRQTSSETELPNGLILPTGTQCVIHLFDLHRNPKYWNAPEQFDPDRFLPENSKDRHNFAYVPFSAGQRNCIGQKYAILEIKTLLIYILKHFKILPITKAEDIILHSGITLCVTNDVKVKFVVRK